MVFVFLMNNLKVLTMKIKSSYITNIQMFMLKRFDAAENVENHVKSHMGPFIYIRSILSDLSETVVYSWARGARKITAEKPRSARHQTVPESS